MKATIIQTDIAWANPQANIANAEQAIGSQPGSDLYILPEMFSTGFCTNPEGIAEAADGPSLQWMKHKAAQLQCAIAGSVATIENGQYYNRFYFVHPDGQADCYDKKHLFTYGGEHHHFSPGNRRVVVEHKGVRILLQVCYDLRFPVWSRNTGDYDMALYVASWPTVRLSAWNTLLHARALENQCYVAAVNRTGNDPYCQYSGGSRIIDPYGHDIATCADGQQCTATADIDLNILRDFRKKFPVLDDADTFNLL